MIPAPPLLDPEPTSRQPICGHPLQTSTLVQNPADWVCQRPARLFENGRGYCKAHAPSEIERRNQERRDKLAQIETSREHASEVNQLARRIVIASQYAVQRGELTPYLKGLVERFNQLAGEPPGLEGVPARRDDTIETKRLVLDNSSLHRQQQS